MNLRAPGTALLALVLAGAGARATTPRERLFRDSADAVTADYAERIESQLRALDRETPGRLVVALFAAPEGDPESFVTATAEDWRRDDPRLDGGAILFYFTRTQQVRVWTGARLAGRLEPGEPAKSVAGVFRGPGAYITFPDSLEKCVRLLSAQIRNALDEGRGTWRGRLARRYRLLRASAGNEFGVLVAGAVFLFFFAIGVLWSWTRSVGETISSGKRRHETPGQIALDVGKKAGIGTAKLAAGLAIEAAAGVLGGGSSGSGDGFSGGGGSFGGGGASGSW